MFTRSLRSAALVAAIPFIATASAVAQSSAAGGSSPAKAREAIVRQLQPEGEVYSYTVFGPVLEARLKALTEQISAIAHDPEDAPFRQDYAAIARDLGLTSLNGLGYSSAPMESGYENRVFFYLPAGRPGLWSLLGGEPHAFETAIYAPADADVFFETDVQLDTAVKAALSVASRVAPEKAAEFAIEKLTAKDSTGALRLLLSLRTRVTFVARTGAFMPKPDAVNPEKPLAVFLRIEGVAAPLRAALKAPKWEKRSESGRDYFRSKESAAMPFDPVIVLEGDTAYAASSEAFFQECITRGAQTLATTEAFREGLRQVGETGNSISYLSPRLFTFLRSTAGELRSNELLRMAARSQVPFLDYLTSQLPSPTHPIVSVSRNLPDGVLSRSWSPKSLSTQQFALHLFNPELLGDLAGAAIFTAFSESRQERERSKSLAAIELNLKRIDGFAREYFSAQPDATEVTFAQLVEVHPDLAHLTKHAGEDYSSLTLQKNSDVVELATETYNTARFVRPLTEEETAKIRANLAVFDEAAALFFTKNPEETSMSSYDAGRYVSGIPDKLVPVMGESYSSIYLARDEKEIAVTTPGEQKVVYPRDPAVRWKALKKAAAHEADLRTMLAPAFEVAQKYLTPRSTKAKGDAATTEVEPLADETPTTVSLQQLISDGHAKLPDGMTEDDAATLNFYRGKYELTGSLSGETYRVLMPLPSAQRAAIMANLQKVARALGEYLAKHPTELVVYAGEIAQPTNKTLPTLPAAVVGEDYGMIAAQRGENVVTLTLPTGHALTVPMNPTGK